MLDVGCGLAVYSDVTRVVSLVLFKSILELIYCYFDLVVERMIWHLGACGLYMCRNVMTLCL